MADVKIKSTYTVKPAGPTWTGTDKLGDWEQMVAGFHVPTIYFYRPAEDWAGSGQSMVETLKESLGRALVHFYPLAGRVHRLAAGRVELRCEGQGAELIEAESSSELTELGDFSCFEKFQRLIPMMDMRKPIHELPVMAVQVSRFRCGGVALGVAMIHGIADGMSAFHFLKEWTRLARGEPIQTPPIFDRSLLRAGEPPRGPGFADADASAAPPPMPPPPMMDGEPMVGMPPMKPTSMVTLPLSKAQIGNLRNTANSSAGDHQNDTSRRPFSRYEVLTAHIWRCLCKTKGSKGEKPTALGITLDARSRIKPPLPAQYFGSPVLMVAAGTKAGDLTAQPIGHACNLIRDTISRVTDEYIWTDIDDLKRSEDLGVMRGMRNPIDLTCTMPDLGVISWLTLPVHGLDFGWGDHAHMSPGPTLMEGITNLLPGKDGDGSALVVICLGVENVEKFKKYFYDDLE